MSDGNIPAPDEQSKPYLILDTNVWRRYRVVTMVGAMAHLLVDPSTTSPIDLTLHSVRTFGFTHPPVDPSTTSPIDLTLHSVRTFGFTHPSNGRFLMVPKEFQAILLRETKAVASVVWEVMQQTIGWEGSGTGGRREWAPLTVRYFERAQLLSRKHAEKGIARALAMGYIERRQRGAGRYEYRLRWKRTN